MKKLLILLLSATLISNIYATDTANMHIKIAGATQDNRYFLCVSHVGCVSVLQGDKGRVYPMTQGELNNIFLVNIANMKRTLQPLPDSCHVNITNGQTITVTGKISKDAHTIENLHCNVG